MKRTDPNLDVNLGSRKSRNASPNRFVASTVNAMVVPGKMTSHHGGWNDCASTPPSMFPRLGVGGGTPTPRKLKAASAKIAEPRLTVAMTATGAIHCGAI